MNNGISALLIILSLFLWYLFIKYIIKTIRRLVSPAKKKSSSIFLSEVNEDKKVKVNDVKKNYDYVAELQSLVGLERVKKEVASLINFIKVQKERKDSGLNTTAISYHLVLTGNPGTGKTTVARIIAGIYKNMGILSKGQLVESDRADLIAGYEGQTATKVDKVIDSAIDGVLFIDEAYSLLQGNDDAFGKEAIAALIKRMEDDRDKLVVVLAGYTEEMRTFINGNPGFKSRFNRYIDFADYNPGELFEIYQYQCKKQDYVVTDEGRTKLLDVFTKAYNSRDRSFGNGRYARNIFEKTLELQANRLSTDTSLDKNELTTITADDIPES
ncbi:MAG TPA: AAA family ATPase [Chitinophagaceae bacterium]|nr:AAA family ATPase [Chitinophagaceae bacterium]